MSELPTIRHGCLRFMCRSNAKCAYPNDCAVPSTERVPSERAASRDCEHGQLARSCRICELEAERDEKDRQLTSCYDRMDRAERALAEARAKEREYDWLLGKMVHQQSGPNVGWTLDILLPGDCPREAIQSELTDEAKP